MVIYILITDMRVTKNGNYKLSHFAHLSIFSDTKRTKGMSIISSCLGTTKRVLDKILKSKKKSKMTSPPNFSSQEDFIISHIIKNRKNQKSKKISDLRTLSRKKNVKNAPENWSVNKHSIFKKLFFKNSCIAF